MGVKRVEGTHRKGQLERSLNGSLKGGERRDGQIPQQGNQWGMKRAVPQRGREKAESAPADDGGLHVSDQFLLDWVSMGASLKGLLF